MDKRKNRYRCFLKALGLSLRIKSPFCLVVNILGFGAAFIPMLISIRLQTFTNNVQSLFERPELLKTTITSFVALAVLYFTQIIFSHIRRYTETQDAERIKRYQKEQILNLLSSVPFKYIENQSDFHKKVSFINQFGGEKATGSISLLFSWVANIVAFFGVVYILWAVNLLIVIAIIATSIPAVILSSMQKDETYRFRTKQMKDGQLTWNYSDTCRQPAPMKEIRFFGLYGYFKKMWLHTSKEWMRKKKAVARKHFLFNGIADIFRNGVYLIIVLIAVRDIYSNPEIGLGAFMLVISAAGQLQTITATLLTNAVSIFTDAKYIEDFFNLLDTEKEDVSKDDTIYENVFIEFDNVSFSYPNSNVLALNGFSVKIKQGEKVAIVGSNGSGKSTFISLLCGLYEPLEGTAKINGGLITDNLWRVRHSISVIFQYFCQYQDTLRNNIAVSDILNSRNDEAILNLAKETGADEVISKQKNTLDETIGLFSSEGKNLSGGQWQKIAITRALFRKNAKVYILDEPTASLDPIAETNIYRNFANLTKDKTTILISHRLGVTSVVDRILVFDKGKIAEDGSHSELMAKNGLYTKMYKAQAKWYQ